MSANYIQIINGLLGVAGTLPIPGAQYAAIAGTLISHIAAQTGKTADQILDDAGVTEDDNRRMLLEDLARLQSAPPAPVPVPPAQPPAPAPRPTPQPQPVTPLPTPPKERTVVEIEAKLATLRQRLEATTDANERTILEARITRNEILLADAQKKS